MVNKSCVLTQVSTANPKLTLHAMPSGKDSLHMQHTHTHNRQELSLVWTCGNVGRSTWPGRVGDPVRGRAKCDPVRGRAKCDPVRGRAKCDPVRGRAKCDPVCSRLAEGNIYDCRFDSKVAERQRERDGRPGTEYERGECPTDLP